MPEGSKVMVYARVSTEEQNTIQEQIETIKSECKHRKWKIYQVQYEKRTASADEDETDEIKYMNKRPVLKGILDNADSNIWQILVVWKHDRLSRSSYFGENIIKRLSQKDILYHSATDSNDAFAAKIHRAAAEEEVQKIRERTMLKMNSLWEKKGKVMYRPPFGYLKYKNRNSLVISQSKAEKVRKAFRIFLEGKSKNQIAKELNLSYDTIRYMLHNNVYLGIIKWGDEWKKKHKPIIDQATFDAVQEKLGQKKEATIPAHLK